MYSDRVFFARMSLLGTLAVAMALCLGGIATAQSTEDVAPSGDLQRLARVVTVFEIARSHLEQWESNPAARTLVVQMTEDLVREANLDVNWKSRLFLKEEDRTDAEPDDFERAAIAKLINAKDPGEAIWNTDRNRVVSAVTAHKSCVNCHDASVGKVMGHVSLEFKASGK